MNQSRLLTDKEIAILNPQQRKSYGLWLDEYIFNREQELVEKNIQINATEADKSNKQEKIRRNQEELEIANLQKMLLETNT